MIDMRLRLLLLLPTGGFEGCQQRTAEYTDKRISLFFAQWGKCDVTGRDFHTLDEVHCHNKTPKENGGGDESGNLVLILEHVHRLIHHFRPVAGMPDLGNRPVHYASKQDLKPAVLKAYSIPNRTACQGTHETYAHRDH